VTFKNIDGAFKVLNIFQLMKLKLSNKNHSKKTEKEMESL